MTHHAFLLGSYRNTATAQPWWVMALTHQTDCFRGQSKATTVQFTRGLVL